MATKMLQPWSPGCLGAWTRQQHGVVTRRQLLDARDAAGRRSGARLKAGRLHRALAAASTRSDARTSGGSAELMAATLACGPGARLSHRSAAELWRICASGSRAGSTSRCRRHSSARRPGIRLHRRAELGPTRIVHGIPVGDPISVLIDLATCLPTTRSKTRSTRRTGSTSSAPTGSAPALDAEPEAPRRRAAEGGSSTRRPSAGPRTRSSAASSRSSATPACPRPTPSGSSAATGSTSSGPSSASWSRPTASATTAPPPSRRWTSSRDQAHARRWPAHPALHPLAGLPPSRPRPRGARRRLRATVAGRRAIA